MRICQISPLFESVPPRCYGGTERVVHYLTEELVRRGHDVVLFASGDSNAEIVLEGFLNHAEIRDQLYKKIQQVKNPYQATPPALPVATSEASSSSELVATLQQIAGELKTIRSLLESGHHGESR